MEEFRPGGERVVGMKPFEPTQSWTLKKERNEYETASRWCFSEFEIVLSLEDPVERILSVERGEGYFWYSDGGLRVGSRVLLMVLVCGL